MDAHGLNMSQPSEENLSESGPVTVMKAGTTKMYNKHTARLLRRIIADSTAAKTKLESEISKTMLCYMFSDDHNHNSSQFGDDAWNICC